VPAGLPTPHAGDRPARPTPNPPPPPQCLLLRLLEPMNAPIDALRRAPTSKRGAEQRAHKQVRSAGGRPTATKPRTRASPPDACPAHPPTVCTPLPLPPLSLAQRCCKEYRAAVAAWLAEHVAVVDERGAWMDRWWAAAGPASGLTALRGLACTGWALAAGLSGLRRIS
jgi:hypothetical protein